MGTGLPGIRFRPVGREPTEVDVLRFFAGSGNLDHGFQPHVVIAAVPKLMRLQPVRGGRGAGRRGGSGLAVSRSFPRQHCLIRLIFEVVASTESRTAGKNAADSVPPVTSPLELVAGHQMKAAIITAHQEVKSPLAVAIDTGGATALGAEDQGAAVAIPEGPRHDPAMSHILEEQDRRQVLRIFPGEPGHGRDHVPVTSGKANQEVRLPGSGPRAGPEAAPPGLTKAAVEPQEPSESIHEGSGGAPLRGFRCGNTQSNPCKSKAMRSSSPDAFQSATAGRTRGGMINGPPSQRSGLGEPKRGSRPPRRCADKRISPGATDDEVEPTISGPVDHRRARVAKPRGERTIEHAVGAGSTRNGASAPSSMTGAA